MILVALGLASFALWWLLVARQNPARPPITHPATLEKVAPSRAQAAIRAAIDVEAVLTESGLALTHPHRMLSRDSLICGYGIRSTPVRLAEAQRSELVALLLDRLSYQNERPPCLFMPNVAYRFIAPAETLDVLVCLGCYHVMFVETDSTGSSGLALPVRARLMDVSRGLFPQDSVIVAIWRKEAWRDSTDAARAERRRK